MALESCKPGSKKNALLASYQQSFRIDDLLRQKAIQQQQPDHFPVSHGPPDEQDTFKMGPVPPPKLNKTEVIQCNGAFFLVFKCYYKTSNTQPKLTDQDPIVNDTNQRSGTKRGEQLPAIR